MLDLKALLAKILNHINNVGNWITDIPSAVSCGTAKFYKIASVTLTAGTWIIFTCGNFPVTNATGYRDIYTTTTDFTNGVTTGPANYAFITRLVIPAGNYAQVLNASFPVKISSQTTFYLVGHQNSGSTMSVTGRMYAVRIK